MRWVGLFVIVAFLGACPKPTPPPVNPSPDADAGPAPAQAADCGAACRNEKALHCPAAVTCAELCPRLIVNQSAYVLCVTRATTCDGVTACHAPVGANAAHGPGVGRTGP